MKFFYFLIFFLIFQLNQVKASYILYHVQKNDNLFRISKKYNIPLLLIKELNNISDSSKIFEGSVLKIPELNNQNVIHIVQPGDTFYSVSREYNIKLDELLTINSLNENDILLINTELKIPAALREQLENENLEKITGYSIFEESRIFKSLPQAIKTEIKNSKDLKKKFIELYKIWKDQEELFLYINKIHFLPKNYYPKDLVEVSNIFPANKSPIYLRKIVIQDLKEMYTSARQENINLLIISGYRTFKYQYELLKSGKIKYGEEAINYIAPPGASEHHLGSAIDFNALKQTEETDWLEKNAYLYGFIQSYPKNNKSSTGYNYEPWHFRYIGKDAAFIVNYYFNNQLDQFLSWLNNESY